MDKEKLEYYFEMKRRNRLIPVRDKNGCLAGFFTFFIGNGNPQKYVNKDSWSVVDDETNGDTCYIDHLIRNTEYKQRVNSFSVWKSLKQYIKLNYPLVNKLRWNRWKNNKVKTHLKYLKNKEEQNETV